MDTTGKHSACSSQEALLPMSRTWTWLPPNVSYSITAFDPDLTVHYCALGHSHREGPSSTAGP